MPMKLPKMTAQNTLTLQAIATFDGNNSSQEERYRLSFCTVNLGAKNKKTGHPTLKHCFVKVLNAQNEVIETIAYGRAGVGAEAYPDLDSAHCETANTGLNQHQKDGFIDAVKLCEQQAYRWGSNDCCSCINKAAMRSLRMPALENIRQASADIALAPEVFL